MTKEQYHKQLKTKTWDKLRKKVLKRDKFKCTSCGAKNCMLHVHHTYYTEGAKAWEYPLEALVTLCEPCHTKIHDTTKLKDFMRPRVKKGTKHLPLVNPTQSVKDSEIKKAKPKHYRKPKPSGNPEKDRNKRIRKQKAKKRK